MCKLGDTCGMTVHLDYGSSASLRVSHPPCARSSPVMAAVPTTAALSKVTMERVEAVERLRDVSRDVHHSSGRSESSLLSAFRRARLGAPHLHGNSILTASEDQSLAYTAQAFSYANAALTRADLASLVKELWGKEVGETWAREWIRGHKNELSTRA